MTARELYNAALIEINKLEAPSLLLEDYLYLINKAIYQYTNKVYNRYEINQQATDDLAALKVSAKLEIKTVPNGEIFPNEVAEYYCALPEDYFHLLSCSVSFKNTSGSTTGKCPSKVTGANLVFRARKLTSDIDPSILDNAYLKPDYKRPYYFITKVKGEDIKSEADKLADLLRSTGSDVNDDELTGKKMQIRCGNNTKYIPEYAYINYIKVPDKISLTYSDLDMADGVDHSEVLEFPDYVCYEIINELSKLLLENYSDPRLQTNPQINQTIAVPGTKS